MFVIKKYYKVKKLGRVLLPLYRFARKFIHRQYTTSIKSPTENSFPHVMVKESIIIPLCVAVVVFRPGLGPESAVYFDFLILTDLI